MAEVSHLGASDTGAGLSDQAALSNNLQVSSQLAHGWAGCLAPEQGQLGACEGRLRGSCTTAQSDLSYFNAELTLVRPRGANSRRMVCW